MPLPTVVNKCWSGNEESEGVTGMVMGRRKEISFKCYNEMFGTLEDFSIRFPKIYFLTELHYRLTGGCMDKCLRLAVCSEVLK